MGAVSYKPIEFKVSFVFLTLHCHGEATTKLTTLPTNQHTFSTSYNRNFEIKENDTLYTLPLRNAVIRHSTYHITPFLFLHVSPFEPSLYTSSLSFHTYT